MGEYEYYIILPGFTRHVNPTPSYMTDESSAPAGCDSNAAPLGVRHPPSARRAGTGAARAWRSESSPGPKRRWASDETRPCPYMENVVRVIYIYIHICYIYICIIYI